MPDRVGQTTSERFWIGFLKKVQKRLTWPNSSMIVPSIGLFLIGKPVSGLFVFDAQ
jgi:hypothetical protein